jgi:hypothetical protein
MFLQQCLRADSQGFADERGKVETSQPCGDRLAVKPNAESDLRDPDRTLSKTIKRAVRRPKKEPPQATVLEGWAKSAIRGRSKS